MAGRLFHAIVLMGTGMAAACSSSSGDPVATDTGTDTAVKDASIDTFPSIMPQMIDSSPPRDTGVGDTRNDTFPTIAVDTSMPDTFPGIMPMMTDAFPPIA